LNFAMRRDTFLSAGGFDQRYTGYRGEDTDFGKALDIGGTPMAWLKGGLAYHQYHPHHMPPVHHLESVVRNAQLFERMRELSTHDELTGLANRRLFQSLLDSEIDRARRFQLAFSLLVVDIDHFKYLNDRHGHPTGDSALRELAKLLMGHIRKVDSAARVGGEEFMVLLPRADAEDAKVVAEKLRVLLMEHKFVGGQDQPGGSLTVSIGVAELSATDDEHGEAIVARADQALFAAKHAGRNCVFVAPTPVPATV